LGKAFLERKGQKKGRLHRWATKRLKEAGTKNSKEGENRSWVKAKYKREAKPTGGGQEKRGKTFNTVGLRGKGGKKSHNPEPETEKEIPGHTWKSIEIDTGV